MARLAASIKEIGLLNPLTVSKSLNPGHYIIISGHHRHEATLEMLRRGDLPVRLIGGRWCASRSALLQFLIGAAA